MASVDDKEAEKQTRKRNTGKVFEAAIKDAVPDHCLLIRIPDPPQSFVRSSATKFSRQNPCDYLCYDSDTGLLHCWELKTTSGKSMGFETEDDDGKTKMIHRHQIRGLYEFSRHDGVKAGFIFNFRHFEDTPEYIETTYYMDVNDFMKMTASIDKRSFNEIDAVMHGAKRIHGTKKRKRFSWDIDTFLKQNFKRIGD